MSVALGLARLHPASAADRPHYLGFSTPRTAVDDALFEIWNGAADTARVFRVNKDGQIQVPVATETAPAIVAEEDLNTGIYFAGEAGSRVGFAVDGQKIAEVDVSGFKVRDGQVNAPSIAALLDVDTGIWFQTARVNISTSGASRFSVTDDFIQFSVQTRFAHEQQYQASNEPTLVSGTYAAVYANDQGTPGAAELFVKDGAGNVTQLSPHDENGEWVFYSRNKETGRGIRIRMEALLKELEEHLGTAYIEEFAV